MTSSNLLKLLHSHFRCHVFLWVFLSCLTFDFCSSLLMHMLMFCIQGEFAYISPSKPPICVCSSCQLSAVDIRCCQKEDNACWRNSSPSSLINMKGPRFVDLLGKFHSKHPSFVWSCVTAAQTHVRGEEWNVTISIRIPTYIRIRNTGFKWHFPPLSSQYSVSVLYF